MSRHTFRRRRRLDPITPMHVVAPLRAGKTASILPLEILERPSSVVRVTKRDMPDQHPGQLRLPGVDSSGGAR